jgi:hypothetical protein
MHGLDRRTAIDTPAHHVLGAFLLWCLLVLELVLNVLQSAAGFRSVSRIGHIVILVILVLPTFIWVGGWMDVGF